MSINTPPAFVYISPGLLDNMRRETRRFLLHRYTRIARNANDDQQDTWGQQTYTFSPAVTDIPCFYAIKEVPIVTPEGLTTLNLPVLTLGFDDPTQQGDIIAEIHTPDGTALLTSQVEVESLQPRDPNMGGPVFIEAHLRQIQFIPTGAA